MQVAASLKFSCLDPCELRVRGRTRLDKCASLFGLTRRFGEARTLRPLVPIYAVGAANFWFLDDANPRDHLWRFVFGFGLKYLWFFFDRGGLRLRLYCRWRLLVGRRFGRPW